MKKRLFLYTTLIMLIGLVSFFAATAYSSYSNNLMIAEDSVMETARICARLYNDDMDIEAFVNAGDNTRITVIASSGAVIADSRSRYLDSGPAHLDRPEIQAAAAGAPKAFARYSPTLGVEFLYYALKVDTGDGDYVFVRAAMPITAIDTYMSQSLPFLALIFIVVAALCFAVSRAMINRMTTPLETVRRQLSQLSEWKYRQNQPENADNLASIKGDYEEIDAIISGIDDVAQVLQENFKEFKDEKNKAEYVLNNINDGIFAVNLEKDVALINNAAQSIFGVTKDVVGKSLNYLTYNKMLFDAVEQSSVSGRFSLTELQHEGKIYILTIKRLDGTDLTMVVLSDVTDSRESAKRREEFFENASHELKTPLTAIRGFNELCSLKNNDENLNKYIDGISRETDRMLKLIGDMLRLSELSVEKEINPVPVALREVAGNIAETLDAALAERSLKLEITGDCTINAEPEHAYELLKNLMENAVRYNTDGGRVTVSLSRARLIVSDTGIGIPVEAQSQLFERFYRVEKSRSIQSGGTGLGLSIVKHICALYGWGLSLHSRPNVGTDVTVTFK